MPRINIFSDESVRDVKRMFDRHRAEILNVVNQRMRILATAGRQSGEGNWYNDAQWFSFKNDSGETIPAHGIVRITGMEDSGAERLAAAKPNRTGSQYRHFVNWKKDVIAGAYGKCTQDITRALYDSADGTPAFGEQWGPISGSWKLRKNVGGWTVYGNVVTQSTIVTVRMTPWLAGTGKLKANLNEGGTADVDVYADASDTGHDHEVACHSLIATGWYIPSGADIGYVYASMTDEMIVLSADTCPEEQA